MNLELTPLDLLNHIRSLASSFSTVTGACAHSTIEKNTDLNAKSVPESSVSKNTLPLKLLLAYSGGLDSHVLLHLLASVPKNQLQLRATYINHGLQDEAKTWVAHCKKACEALDVPYSSVDLNLSVPDGESIEEVARNARYEALKAELKKNEVLMTAHHQNDQAETFLLQLFRGAGVQGLASMPEAIQLNPVDLNQFHFRPLLSVSRNALESYAKRHSLVHIEDPSNKDTAFDRNYLRQDIMPQLRERWLGIDKTISRSAAIQAETQSLLDEFAVEQLPSVLSKQITHSQLSMTAVENKQQLLPIDIHSLRKHSRNKQRLLLRYWISQQGFTNPSEKKITHVFSDLIDAADDKQPLIEWKGVQLRRYQQHLYIMSPLSEHDATQVLFWQTNTSLFIKSISMTLDATLLNSIDLGNNKNLTVRFRQGGEKINISKRGNVSLKNLFQELNIPPWMRSRLPLLYFEDRLLKIVGLEGYKRHPPPF